ncbi:SH3 domain-binding glutamic acid-rich-like protein isoform X2 [Phyllostomus discolor]|uniref:SH3 domain-binding glutamic acid-rich-like protein isoform X2 n=1 Tax=Phyllostomus discolor TaxID=89673 RepID=A0A7E6D0R4_9CHIR|nr:SH3 domain-binding glutamic acid-rich-like protein isoform X2 [Phyllostomus discolor]
MSTDLAVLFEIPLEKIRNDANKPVPSGIWGWDCRALSPVKAAKGGGGALASSPSTFPHPSLPTSVRLLAQLQPLLPLLSSHLQDPNYHSRCSQDGDPCVYCIFLWLYSD